MFFPLVSAYFIDFGVYLNLLIAFLTEIPAPYLHGFGPSPQKPPLLVEIIGKHRPRGGGAGVALAEFDLEQETLAAIGPGVLAQKFWRLVTQGKAARVSEQGAKRRVGSEIDFLGGFPDINDRRRAVEQHRCLVVVGKKRIGDGPEIDDAIRMECAEIAVEAGLAREGDGVWRGVFPRHRPRETGVASGAARAGIGGEVGLPHARRAPPFALWRRIGHRRRR